MERIIGYLGTYDAGGSEGIYKFEFDASAKRFQSVEVAYGIRDAKYLSLRQGVIAFPYKNKDAGVGFLKNGKSYTYSFGDSVACYVTQDENFVYTANYHDGTLGVFEKTNDGLRKKQVIEIQKKGGCHQVMLHDRHIIVPCLLLDKVQVYDKESLQHVKTCNFPLGSGPRHGVIHPDKKRLFMISELSCELYLLDETYNIVRSWKLLEERQKGAGAAIRMSQDGRFLYMSIRDVNKLYVFDIEKEEVIQVIDCKGDHPRDIALDDTDQFLFVANRFSNEVVVFERDTQTGKLKDCNASISVPEAVSIVFEE